MPPHGSAECLWGPLDDLWWALNDFVRYPPTFWLVCFIYQCSSFHELSALPRAQFGGVNLSTILCVMRGEILRQC